MKQDRYQIWTIPTIAVIFLITTTLPAFAITINQNPPISCGNLYWGIDNHQNPTYQTSYKFGRNTSCVAQHPAWPSGTTTTNYVQLNVRNNLVDIAWQAGAQGNPLSPWNFGAEDTTPQIYPTSGFPATTTPPTPYQLKTQWVWTNERTPALSIPEDKMRVYMLTDVVLQSTSNPNKYILIDFLTDAMKNQNGIWTQLPISDKDTAANLDQYYDTKCKVSGGKLIYYYNAILDNSATSYGMWQDKTFSIGSHFTATNGMFGSHYRLDSGCTVNDPGVASDFQIRSISAGAEVFRQTSTNYVAEFRGGYSWVELFY